MPAICRCGEELIWDPAYGFVCIRCGAKPWRCMCGRDLKEIEQMIDREIEEEKNG